jgi:hypothetical protein
VLYKCCISGIEVLGKCYESITVVFLKCDIRLPQGPSSLPGTTRRSAYCLCKCVWCVRLCVYVTEVLRFLFCVM